MGASRGCLGCFCFFFCSLFVSGARTGRSEIHPARECEFSARGSIRRHSSSHPPRAAREPRSQLGPATIRSQHGGRGFNQQEDWTPNVHFGAGRGKKRKQSVARRVRRTLDKTSSSKRKQNETKNNTKQETGLVG